MSVPVFPCFWKKSGLYQVCVYISIVASQGSERGAETTHTSVIVVSRSPAQSQEQFGKDVGQSRSRYLEFRFTSYSYPDTFYVFLLPVRSIKLILSFNFTLTDSYTYIGTRHKFYLILVLMRSEVSLFPSCVFVHTSRKIYAPYPLLCIRGGTWYRIMLDDKTPN